MVNIFIDFSMSPVIYTALMVSFAIPILLIVFSHRPFKMTEAGSRRFKVVVFLVFIMWVGLLWLLDALPRFETTSLLTFMPGIFIFGTAILASFSAWDLLSASITLSMLLSLPSQGIDTVDTEEWAHSYGGGRGLEGLLHDRLALLIRFGVVTQRDNIVTLTPGRGIFVAKVTKLFRFIFGLR